MKTSQEDWLRMGLELLRDGGEDALTIDRLCRELRRTKGSFYHHFEDIAAYSAAMLELWEQLHTEQPIVDASSGDRRKRLYASVAKVDLGVELAVHAWAVRSEVARKAVQRVHQRRIGFLEALREGDPQARAKAEVEYAAFIGSLHIYTNDQAARVRVLLNASRMPIPSKSRAIRRSGSGS